MSIVNTEPDPLSKYPLVDRYFGAHLRKLLGIRQTDPSYRGTFVLHAFYAEALEARLLRIEPLGQTHAIVNEVGDGDNSGEVDKRLMDAWAEIRVLDQLQREAFQHIRKTAQTMDFTAEKDGTRYAFQVTHINKTLSDQVIRHNPPDRWSTSPYGDIDEIHSRLDDPASWLFWDRLESKNADLRNWPSADWRRCIVLVTNQEQLQDRMVRHIVCQGLRACIHDLVSVHFEEVLWLLDDGNGAWFIVDGDDSKVSCYADWKDEFPGPKTDFRPADVRKVRRTEVDLDSHIPAWKGSLGGELQEVGGNPSG